MRYGQQLRYASITFTKSRLTLRKWIINLRLIIKCITDTLLINFAENWQKRQWSIIIKSLLPFLCTRTIWPLFQLLGTFPVSNENWKILKWGLTEDSSQILIIRTDTLPHPWAFLTSKAQIIEVIFAGSIFTDSKRWWVSRYLTGNSLPVSIKEHCFAKIELKVFAFTKVSAKNVLFRQD